MNSPLSTPEQELALVRALAEFWYQLRCFALFSEQAAQAAELQPQQHQLMLQVAGSEPGYPVTITYAAERLGLCHNSTVELVNRCVTQDLLTRKPDPVDGRKVLLKITPKGRRLLLSLSEHHARELGELAPQLILALKRVRRTRRSAIKLAPNPASVQRYDVPSFTTAGLHGRSSCVVARHGSRRRRRLRRGAGSVAAALHRLGNQSRLLPSAQLRSGLSSRYSAWLLGCARARARGRRSPHRLNGPLWFGEDSGPRHTGSNRGILLRDARVQPRLAILKPLSAAISIGSGGPFGAEGPIIMTGGAFGSLIAQVMHLSDAERTTLLVAGAAAGMSATLRHLSRQFFCS